MTGAAEAVDEAEEDPAVAGIPVRDFFPSPQAPQSAHVP